MSTCKSCGAPIAWFRSTKGTPMPINPTKQLGGNIEVRDGVATVVKPDPAVLRHTSHHSNCPNANGHRKSRVR